MRTSYLRHFVDIAELGSIAAAAQKNYITYQGMSRSLSVLETELGCELFKRTPNRLVLTACGEALLDDAREMLALQRHMAETVAAVRERTVQASELPINVFLNNIAFDAALFSPLTDSFEGIFANARYLQCDNAEVVDNLIARADDDASVNLGLLCLFNTDDRRNEELVGRLRANGFVYQPYLHSFDSALVSSRSPLARKKALSRADILSQPIVSSDGDVRRVTEQLFGEQAIRMVTSDSAFRFRVVASNEGITFVPAFHVLMDAAGADRDATVMVPLKEPYYLEVGFAAKRDVWESPYIRSVVARLNAYYSQFADSPYLTLIASDLSLMRLDDAERRGCDEHRLTLLTSTYGLSARERDVFRLLADGLTAEPIAERLCVSVPTAKSHIYRIYKKLGVHSQKDLIALAAGEG